MKTDNSIILSQGAGLRLALMACDLEKCRTFDDVDDFIKKLEDFKKENLRNG